MSANHVKMIYAFENQDADGAQMITERVLAIRTRAVEAIESDTEALLALTSQPYFSDDCKELLSTILHWHSTRGSRDNALFQFLWEMWHNALPVESATEFIPSLLSFFGHDILDDGGFIIKWEKTVGKGWDLATVATDSKDPDTLPVVYRSTADDSRSDPRLLIEVMKEAIVRQQRKAAWREEVAEKIKNLTASIRKQ
jgi:hypothetical protein